MLSSMRFVVFTFLGIGIISLSGAEEGKLAHGGDALELVDVLDGFDPEIVHLRNKRQASPSARVYENKTKEELWRLLDEALNASIVDTDSVAEQTRKINDFIKGALDKGAPHSLVREYIEKHLEKLNAMDSTTTTTTTTTTSSTERPTTVANLFDLKPGTTKDILEVLAQSISTTTKDYNFNYYDVKPYDQHHHPDDVWRGNEVASELAKIEAKHKDWQERRREEETSRLRERLAAEQSLRKRQEDEVARLRVEMELQKLNDRRRAGSGSGSSSEEKPWNKDAWTTKSYLDRFRRNVVDASTLATLENHQDTVKDMRNLMKGYSGDLETLDDHKNVEEDLLPEKLGLPALPCGGHRDHSTRDEVYKGYNNHDDSSKMPFGDVGVRQIYGRKCCRFDCDRLGRCQSC